MTGSSIYTDLTWLPPPSNDHSARCIDLSHASGEIGRQARELSNCRLDVVGLTRLSRSISGARLRGCTVAPLQELGFGLLTNATAALLEHALVASAPRHGLVLNVSATGYGQAMQDALSPDSPLHTSQPAIVLCALDHRWYPLRACPGDPAGAAEVVEACVSQLRTLVTAVRQHSGASCMIQTLSLPLEPLFGSLDRSVPGSLLQLTDDLNRAIADLAKETDSILLDVCTLSALTGNANWQDPASWNEAKLPMHRSVLPLYADHVMRLVAAHLGKARRCLILDLDNTLWGGIIGDDGLEGIRIGQGDPIGEAHLEVQRFALAMRSRGIVLAVCSKNTDEVARRPFLEHPDMLLKLDHIAVFQANWSDKASNIQAIAQELSLGLESMVFVDDNPMERDIVRRMLPQVVVPELPDDPADYVRTISAAGYFESTRFSKEDLARADFYRDNSRRAALAQKAGDLQSYLASLDMQITFQPFDETGRARIAQLISKSNQFNLTTRRYSETEVASIQHDPSCYARQIRLTDTFGDNGMISVVIARRSGLHELEIDTWLMSCRVLGRRVENVVLQELIEHARSQGLQTIVGRYIPTDRNALVKDHYSKLGFSLASSLAGGETVWHLDVATAPLQAAPMKVLHIAGGKAPESRAAQLRSSGQEDTAPVREPSQSISLDTMASIWSDVFLRKVQGTDAHFFDMGGDSLAALTLVEAVSDRLGRRIPLHALIEQPTLGGFTRVVNGEAAGGNPLLVTLKNGSNDKKLFVVHGYGGSVMELRPLALSLSGDYSVTGIRASGLEAGEPVLDRIEAMADAYLKALRKEQPAGPYWIAGYSSGGLIAYQMAQSLAQRGETISAVVLLDTVLHPSNWSRRVWGEFIARRTAHHLKSLLKAERPLKQLVRAARSFVAHFGRALDQTSVPLNRHEEQLPEHIRQLREAGLHAQDNYMPPASDLPLIVIRSDLKISNLPDPRLIWQPVSTRVTVADVPGDHGSMISAEHVQSLGSTLSGLLQATSL